MNYMIEIINEFFSKESKINNITIEQLLKEYEVDEKVFWNYVYNYDLVKKMGIVNRIKSENEIRNTNKSSLEIYRELKQNKNNTFGDIARHYHISIDRVIELLNHSYLKKGIRHYSFQQIQKNNLELLRQKEEFEMYFYFIEHPVTFEEIAKKFQKEESQVIHYFDEYIQLEIAETQIQKIFKINKLRQIYNIRKNNLYQFNQCFLLTPQEIAELEYHIHHLKNSDTPRKHLVLKLIEKYLSNPTCTMAEAAEEEHTRQLHIKNHNDNNWLYQLLSPEIIAKLEIRTFLADSGINLFKDPAKIEKIRQYLKLYGEWLNQPIITLEAFFNGMDMHPWDGKALDQELGTHVFQTIEDIMKPVLMKREEQSNCIEKLILFTKKLEAWKEIERKKRFQETLPETTQLLEVIDQKVNLNELDKQDSYIEKLIHSCQFTALYVLQPNYDVKELMRLFDIQQRHTASSYLHHPIVQKLIGEEMQKYIAYKRSICTSMIREDNYLNHLTHDEKGQFIKK